MTDESQMQATGDVGDLPEWPVKNIDEFIALRTDMGRMDHEGDICLPDGTYTEALADETVQLLRALRARLDLVLDMLDPQDMPMTDTEARAFIAACREPKL